MSYCGDSDNSSRSLTTGSRDGQTTQHLEPHRHIPYVTDLDGLEAATIGPVLARVTAVLCNATAADRVYVYVFGDRVPHLHLNLAPHRPGDALVGGPGLLRAGAPDVAVAAHRAAADAVRHALRD